MHVRLALPRHFVRAPRDVREKASVVREPRVGGREERVKPQLRAENLGARPSHPIIPEMNLFQAVDAGPKLRPASDPDSGA